MDRPEQAQTSEGNHTPGWISTPRCKRGGRQTALRSLIWGDNKLELAGKAVLKPQGLKTVDGDDPTKGVFISSVLELAEHPSQ